MCMEDIRLGRHTQSRSEDVAIATTSTELLKANPDRTRVVISAPLANTLIVNFGKPAASGSGIAIPVGAKPFELDIRDHGQLVMGAINAIVLVAGETITRLETVLPEH